MSFTFNNNYKDHEQVRQYMPEFTALRKAMEAKGDYPYNSCFEGKIADLVGPSEKTAIYLLQCQYGIEREHERMDALRAELRPLTEILTEPTKFARVVLYKAGFYVGGTGTIASFENARIIPKEGKPYAVLPKGKRTNGFRIDRAEVLVSP